MSKYHSFYHVCLWTYAIYALTLALHVQKEAVRAIMKNNLNSVVAADLFIMKHPQSLLIDRSVQAATQPLWSCSATESDLPTTHHPPPKLVFVHIFKTAGSTLRSFFRDYSQQCLGRSYATLTGCTSVPLKTLQLAEAHNLSWEPCNMKDFSNRQGQKQLLNGPVNEIFCKTNSTSLEDIFDWVSWIIYFEETPRPLGPSLFFEMLPPSTSVGKSMSECNKSALKKIWKSPPIPFFMRSKSNSRIHRSNKYITASTRNIY